MFVSIIVPIYNGEKYLEECIKSILEQSYRDFELILVDDGSKDGSLDICRRWEAEDTRITVYAKENGGVSSARNLGIKESKGDYILFVDCDDVLSKDYLLKMAEIVVQEGNDILPISAIEFFGGYDYFIFPQVKESGIEKLEDSLSKIYDECLLFSPVNKLYCKAIIADFHIMFREGVSLGEDVLFNVQYLATGRIKRTSVLANNRYLYRSQNVKTLCNTYDDDYFVHQLEQYKVLFDLFEQYNADNKNLCKEYKRFIGGCPSYYWKKAPKNKIKKAKEILKTKEYQEYLSQRRNTMHKVTWYIYKSNNVPLILLIEKIYDLLHPQK